MTNPVMLLLVHPDDVNLADAKALAADHGYTVVANRWIPRGSVIVVDPAAFEIPTIPPTHITRIDPS